MEKLVKLLSSLRPVSKAEKPGSETCAQLFKKTSLSKINFAFAIKKGRPGFLNLDLKRKGSLKRQGNEKIRPTAT